MSGIEVGIGLILVLGILLVMLGIMMLDKGPRIVNDTVKQNGGRRYGGPGRKGHW